ncbi:MAG: MoaD/ThiS family protein [Planctomycetota bacterium]
MMVVSIDFHGTQRSLTRTHSIHMPITETSKVMDALEYVRRQYPGLTLDERTVLVTVNHQLVPHHQALRPNDKIAFLPPIGGG